jgi:F-type H+-transporting ATPase subunit delta
MKDPILIERYAEGLAGALKTEEEFAAVSREVSAFAGLLEMNAALRKALFQPFLSAARKTQIINEIADTAAYAMKTRRLILLLFGRRRLDLLPEISRALPTLWRERRGIVTFEVRSAVPLDEGQKERLETELRALEKKQVCCRYLTDPAIIGGLHLRKGNMIYDVSLKGQLERFKEDIRER